MNTHTSSKAQRRMARQQLLHVLRSQNLRQKATIERQCKLIAQMERDLIDAGITAQKHVCREK